MTKCKVNINVNESMSQMVVVERKRKDDIRDTYAWVTHTWLLSFNETRYIFKMMEIKALNK